MKNNRWLFVFLFLIGLGVFVGLRASGDRADGRSPDQELIALQKAIKAEGLSWVAGETSMTRLSEEERMRRLGARLRPIQERNLAAALDAEPETEGDLCATPPAGLDWRDNNGNWITPIRDQGNCGSCWAFASAGILEFLVKKAKKIQTDFDLSEQTLVSCSGAGDCDGGYQDDAAQFLKKTGIPRESCFPYSATDEKCKPCSGWMSKAVKILSWRAYSNRTKAVLEAALQDGPINSYMEVYSDFYSYRSGIYKRTAGAAYKGGHAVIIIGYNDKEGYWICKNSWGTDWGEDGFFRIRMGDSEIGSYCVGMSGTNLVNHAPVLNAIPSQSGDEGKLIAFTLSASDSDYDILTYSGANLPSGAAVDPASGSFSWTPDFTQAGVYSIQFAVTDGINKVQRTAVITVANVKYKKW
jgi:hypothetical protein